MVIDFLLRPFSERAWLAVSGRENPNIFQSCYNIATNSGDLKRGSNGARVKTPPALCNVYYIRHPAFVYMYTGTLAHTHLRPIMRIRSACYNNVSVHSIHKIYIPRPFRCSPLVSSGRRKIEKKKNKWTSSSPKRIFFTFVSPPYILFVSHTQAICIALCAYSSLRPRQLGRLTTTTVPTGWDDYKTNRAIHLVFFFF